jgi:hypothetical protein
LIWRALCVTLGAGGSPYHQESGEFKMVVDLLDPQVLRALFLIGVLCTLAAALGYSFGHKDGSREGYTRGRAISRHISQAKREVK